MAVSVSEREQQQRIEKRVVLFPLPLQGNQPPMLQLANILYFSKGFSITTIHTSSNSPQSADYPHFTFHPIPDSLFLASETSSSSSSSLSVIPFLNRLDMEELLPFRDLLSKIVSESADVGEQVCCFITDAMWFFTRAVANSLQLPRIVLRTTSATSFYIASAFVTFQREGLPLSPASQLEEPLQEAKNSHLCK